MSVGIEKEQHTWLVANIGGDKFKTGLQMERPSDAATFALDYTVNQEFMARTIGYVYRAAEAPIIQFMDEMLRVGHMAQNASFRCEQMAPLPHAEFYLASITSLARVALYRHNAQVLSRCLSYLSIHYQLCAAFCINNHVACPALRVKGAPDWSLDDFFLTAMHGGQPDPRLIKYGDTEFRFGCQMLVNLPATFLASARALSVPARLALPVARRNKDGKTLMKLIGFRGGNFPLPWVVVGSDGRVVTSGTEPEPPASILAPFSAAQEDVIGADQLDRSDVAPPIYDAFDRRRLADAILAIKRLELSHQDGANRGRALALLTLNWPNNPNPYIEAAAIVSSFGINPSNPQNITRNAAVAVLQDLSRGLEKNNGPTN